MPGGRATIEITVLCHHWGRHTGGRYWGHEPSGREINVYWYSTVTYKDDNGHTGSASADADIAP